MALLMESLSPSDVMTQSKGVLEQLMDLTVFREARGVAAYVSMEKEFHTAPLLEETFAAGKRCYIPAVKDVRRSEMVLLQAKDMEDISSWKQNSWGIPEPPLDDPDRKNALDDNELDLIIVPGVAFDSSGGRLGHGKGFYDRFLNTLKTRRSELHLKMPAVVGLALIEQIVSEVPVAENDFILDAVGYFGNPPSL
eukprot:Plantae.Rhodophyta-Purpureofilum_apyrenoidigerum.ctg34807.p1 GENE.Plantae.Rhodophyta-Purpureofilum_apyrenoidigerum.ctg34807~~Plantae.Rhodophyta-Purpureofilum_apyrenoidigerum.ctg34807.p1  ORF type:complete len:223 (-),score=61.94 Plantae.Rhodophyta-Purpureofilum_apyrenoidigerum.ctg34807:409-993(-)